MGKIKDAGRTLTGVTAKFKDRAEKNYARILETKYLDEFDIESISDRNTLAELIYMEVIQKRLQEQLNNFYDLDSKAVPINLVEIIHKNSKVIIDLKNALGLNKAKAKKGYDVISHLMKRAKIWRENNQGSRTITCPHCSKLIMLKIRTEQWEAQKHPFFKDKVLYNIHLMDMYKKGKINRDDVAKVLECSPDYVGWLMTKIEGIADDYETDENKGESEKV